MIAKPYIRIASDEDKRVVGWIDIAIIDWVTTRFSASHIIVQRG